jgi:hypothetical protein
MATQSFEECVKGSDYIFHVTPSKVVRNTVKQYKEFVDKQPIIMCSKGFEMESLTTLDEIIEQELWAYSKEIEEAARLQEQTVNNREENVNKNQDSTQKTSQVDKEERESYPMPERQDVSENVNLQDSTQRTNDELADMFTNEPAQDEPTRTYQQQAEKGRVLVKTPTSNNRGQATFLNLCFIFSTIAILGMIISTIILYTQKLFN